LAPQQTSTGEIDRGRQAQSPFHIPWRGWKDIIWRTIEQTREDRFFAVAGSVVFYGLLAVFPAVTAFVSFYGLFASATTIGDHLSFAANILPADPLRIIQDQVSRVVSKGETKLGFAFVLSLAFALGSANSGMKAILDALNVINGERETRSFLLLNVISMSLTFGLIVVLLVSIAAVILLPIALPGVENDQFNIKILQFGRWPALAIMVIVGLTVLYRFGPNRRAARWQWLSVGSVVAAFAWIAGSALLSFYFANFANFDATYGSLGAAMGVMIWMWMSTVVVLFGAELNSEIEHQTAIDTTVGAPRKLGSRGAAMADTVGKTMESN
jgi:membrane protein